MTTSSAATANRSSRIRSRLGNGTRAFADADGRSAGARLLRDREHDLATPLGGLDALDPSTRLKVQSAALLSCRLEELRSAAARGESQVSDEDLVRVGNALARALGALDRLAAKAKPPAPSLADYLASKRAEAAA